MEFKQKDGTKSVLKGYSYMAASPNADNYKPSPKLKKTALPQKVDLRPFMTKVENQKHLSSCTANATAGAYEYLAKKHLKKRAFEVSRLFVYYNARLRASSNIQDKGSFIQYAIDSLHKLGACTEETWPYETQKVNDKPHGKTYEEAANFKVQESKYIPTDLNAWKQCLAEGYPIIFGIALFKGFDDCNKNKGIVPMPSPDEASRKAHGLHAMLCVGYSEVDKMFIVRNSWGEQWGDKGYCYMPYDYVINSKLNMGDSWMIARTAPIPDYEDTWKEDKRSVVDGGKGYDPNKFVVYTEDDYEDFDVFDEIEVVEYDEELPEDYDELEEYEEEEGEDEEESEDEEEYEEEESEDEEEYEEEEGEDEEEYEEEEESEDEEEYEEEEESEDEEEYEEGEESEDEEEYEEEEGEDEEYEEEESEEEYNEDEEEEESEEEYNEEEEAEEEYEEESDGEEGGEEEEEEK
ncbi:C1 family peptidase [Emticicia sp. C21]|uniref:C1 family peptidase n=1 Tax=Emticicia sp. C21 TaxID=2302915 RepID=UPI00131471FB|nr:C1 family peptidase [Emticicia sp. C21]